MRRRIRGPVPSTGAGLVHCLAAVLCLGVVVPAFAQTANVPEIPLTFRPPLAARYAGMGGASIALADDHTACLANPATLSLVRSIEFSAGFNHQDAEMETQRSTALESTDFGKTRLSHIGFAYPFPTYRGSLVVGFAYGRLSTLDSDFSQSGSRDRADFEGIYEEGGLGAYSASAALQVSPEVSIGATGTILSGSDFRERTFRTGVGPNVMSLYQTTDASISGVTGSLGALVQMNSGIRVGVMLNLPESLDFEGSGTDSIDFSFSENIDIPYRIGAGLAFARSNFILGADAIYTDWTQLDYAGPLRTPDRQFAYRETVDLRLGGEVLLSLPFPLRLRAGYLYSPIPYRVLLTDIFNTPDRYEPARFEKDRQYLTAGAGVLLARSLALDVAYMHGGFRRSGERTPSQVYQEELKDNRILASLSLRLR